MDKHKEQQMLPHEKEKNMHAIKETQKLQKQWKEKLACHFVMNVIFLSLMVKYTDLFFFYIKNAIAFQGLAVVFKSNELE